MNLNDLSTQLLFTTVPIWIERDNGDQASATAFIYTHPAHNDPKQSFPFLVTNQHVIKNAKRAVVEFIERNGNGPVLGKRLRVEIDGASLARYIHQQVDIAVLPIAPFLNQLSAAGQNIFYRSITPDLIPSPEIVEKLAAIEEITFIGYPSGLIDDRNSMPIARRGITATPAWNDFKGEPIFLIDAGVFPGSSGSPVFVLNQGSYATENGVSIGSRLLFLGVISESIIRAEASSEKIFLGIGKVVKSQQIKNYIENLVKEFDAQRRSD